MTHRQAAAIVELHIAVLSFVTHHGRKRTGIAMHLGHAFFVGEGLLQHLLLEAVQLYLGPFECFGTHEAVYRHYIVFIRTLFYGDAEIGGDYISTGPLVFIIAVGAGIHFAVILIFVVGVIEVPILLGIAAIGFPECVKRLFIFGVVGFIIVAIVACPECVLARNAQLNAVHGSRFLLKKCRKVEGVAFPGFKIVGTFLRKRHPFNHHALTDPVKFALSVESIDLQKLQDVVFVEFIHRYLNGFGSGRFERHEEFPSIWKDTSIAYHAHLRTDGLHVHTHPLGLIHRKAPGILEGLRYVDDMFAQQWTLGINADGIARNYCSGLGLIFNAEDVIEALAGLQRIGELEHHALFGTVFDPVAGDAKIAHGMHLVFYHIVAGNTKHIAVYIQVHLAFRLQALHAVDGKVAFERIVVFGAFFPANAEVAVFLTCFDEFLERFEGCHIVQAHFAAQTLPLLRFEVHGHGLLDAYAVILLDGAELKGEVALLFGNTGKKLIEVYGCVIFGALLEESVGLKLQQAV